MFTRVSSLAQHKTHSMSSTWFLFCNTNLVRMICHVIYHSGINLSCIFSVHIISFLFLPMGGHLSLFLICWDNWYSNFVDKFLKLGIQIRLSSCGFWGRYILWVSMSLGCLSLCLTGVLSKVYFLGNSGVGEVGKVFFI